MKPGSLVYLKTQDRVGVIIFECTEDQAMSPVFQVMLISSEGQGRLGLFHGNDLADFNPAEGFFHLFPDLKGKVWLSYTLAGGAVDPVWLAAEAFHNAFRLPGMRPWDKLQFSERNLIYENVKQLRDLFHLEAVR